MLETINYQKCCFEKETARLKGNAVGKGLLEGMGAVLGGFVDVATKGLGGSVVTGMVNAVTDTICTVSELDEENCHEKAAKATLERLDNMKELLCKQARQWQLLVGGLDIS